jgi:hypothetical protein
LMASIPTEPSTCCLPEDGSVGRRVSGIGKPDYRDLGSRVALKSPLPYLGAILTRRLSKFNVAANNSVSAGPELRQYPPPFWAGWSGYDF